MYFSPDVIRVMKSRRMRRAGHVATCRILERYIKALMIRPEGKRTLGRPRRT
jgi:hypothetical protein